MHASAEFLIEKEIKEESDYDFPKHMLSPPHAFNNILPMVVDFSFDFNFIYKKKLNYSNGSLGELLTHGIAQAESFVSEMQEFLE